MTELLEHALSVAKELDPVEQDRLARIMLAAADRDGEVYQLNAAETATVAEGIRAAEAGEFATDDEMTATFAKYDA